MKNTFIIAEAGVNHNGKIHIAKKLIDAAKNCGVDAIKFQTYIARNLSSRKALTAQYQSKNKIKQLNLLKKLSLTFDENLILKKYCKKKKIYFLSSAFDIDSLKFLLNLNLKYYKVPSGQIDDLPYLKLLAKKNKKVIISTGMANVKEISKVIEIFKINGTKNKNLSLLHCTSAYPTPEKETNLKTILYLKKKYKIKVGFSDHTIGIDASVASVAMGAEIIEKHFTLNNKMKGPDHKASLEPNELKKMVEKIRVIEKMLGREKKIITPNEKKNIQYVRKSIVAKKNIKKGEKFTIENITTKRPAKGVSPMNFYNLIGKKSKKNFFEDDLIQI